MTPPARRDGTPDRSRKRTHSRDSQRQRTPRVPRVSYAKPARHQHVDAHRAPVTEPTGEGIRLQKVLAKAGVASRRVSEQLIEQGRVEVDGKIVTVQGMRVDPANSVIRVDGVRVVADTSLTYLALNKPYGVHSTMSDEFGRPCIGDIVSEKVAAGQRLFHVGRLDADTEGLILLTNDGELAHRLMHPRFNIRKTYLATVVGEAHRDLVTTLLEGIELDDGPAAADAAQIIDVHRGKSLVRLDIHEGRTRIVRRMLKAAGYPVDRLLRTKIHTVNLGDQKPGTLRALNSVELSSLFTAVGM